MDCGTPSATSTCGFPCAMSIRAVEMGRPVRRALSSGSEIMMDSSILEANPDGVFQALVAATSATVCRLRQDGTVLDVHRFSGNGPKACGLVRTGMHIS